MAKYKPLPDNLTIKKSPIDGLGLFATKDIEVGTNLGVSHIKLEVKQTLQNSVYPSSQFIHYNDGEVIRTPLGGFINHASIPNCKKITGFGTDKFKTSELVTRRYVYKGEELTLKYSLYKI